MLLTWNLLVFLNSLFQYLDFFVELLQLLVLLGLTLLLNCFLHQTRFVKAVHARKHVELFLEHVFRALFALVILVDFDVPVVDLTDLLL